jgi:NADPH:quinone reductase-like Zn-dependent oxidoreductase
VQKVVIHRPGGYDRLLLEEHPTPEPREGEVRVRTRAAGVNYADIAHRDLESGQTTGKLVLAMQVG